MCGIECIVCCKDERDQRGPTGTNGDQRDQQGPTGTNRDQRGLAGNRGNEGFVWILFAVFLLKNQISYFKETRK